MSASKVDLPDNRFTRPLNVKIDLNLFNEVIRICAVLGYRRPYFTEDALAAYMQTLRGALGEKRFDAFPTQDQMDAHHSGRPKEVFALLKGNYIWTPQDRAMGRPVKDADHWRNSQAYRDEKDRLVEAEKRGEDLQALNDELRTALETATRLLQKAIK